MAFDVHETRASSSQGSVQFIDLTEEETEAPFAVREADGSAGAVPGRIPDKAEILAWLEDHPVVVGIATGVLCFSIIAGAMTLVVDSNQNAGSDDPVAGAARSETDGSQGSFSSSGSGGSNFTSDESKLSRTGAGKNVDDLDDGESAAGAKAGPTGPSARNSQPSGRASGGLSLDQNATLNEGSASDNTGSPSDNTGDGRGQATGATLGTNSSTAAIPTTLNPGPNVSGTIRTTPTTNTTPTTPTKPTTATTAGQTSSTPQPTSPTSNPTVPSTSPTTTAPPAPAELMIAAPGHGSSHSFETPTSFAANFISGATEYCWSFIQSGVTRLAACSGGTGYQLPARPSQLNPGLVTVSVTATGSFETLSDSIQISLYRTQVINNPTRDLVIGQNALRVGVVNLEGATQYCFRLSQSGYSSGDLCYSTPGQTFNKNHAIWDSLSPGPLTVSATIYGSGGIMLATDMVTIQLL